MKITKVYLWDNGAVMVFDENDNQMPDYQGMHGQVADLILCNAPDDTTFFYSTWQSPGKKSLTREQFKKGVEDAR